MAARKKPARRRRRNRGSEPSFGSGVFADKVTRRDPGLRSLTKSTGIFVQKWVRPKTPRKSQEIINDERWVGDAEKAARAVLRKHRYPTGRKALLDLLTGESGPKVQDQMVNEQTGVWDAVEIIVNAQPVREQIRTSEDARRTFRLTRTLAEAFLRMRVRPHEPNAVLGKKTRKQRSEFARRGRKGPTRDYTLFDSMVTGYLRNTKKRSDREIVLRWMARERAPAGERTLRQRVARLRRQLNGA